MPERIRPWLSDESLNDLALYVDWDFVSSMIQSLRIHLFEYGTIPTWNFMMCSGRPELSIPHSWAFTWPSLFAYALPPNSAIIALWIALTLVGFFSLRALLLRWSASPLGANTGASLYVFSGYFAARFNGGHVSFAFSHLVPLLIYLFDVSFEQKLRGERSLIPCFLSTLAAFLFATAALPHPLLHFYPVFLLFLLFAVLRAAGRHGLATSLRAAAAPAFAHLLGVWLAAYKLWPVVRWELEHPRKGVLFESYGFSEVVMNTLVLVPDFVNAGQRQAWHLYPPWGYDAFVGPLPWLLAGLVLVWALARRRNLDRGVLDAVLFATIALVAGLLLSLGNANPMSPARLFRHLPVLDGVRAFNRFQVLIVFGLSLLVSIAVPLVVGWFRSPGVRRAVGAALCIGVVGPVLVQAGLLAWNVLAESREEIFRLYRLPETAGTPAQVWNRRRASLRSADHETSLLERGYWVANCYLDLSLPGGSPARDTVRRRVPLSLPPPRRIVRLEHDRITLSYAGAASRVTLKLRQLDGFTTEVGDHEISLIARYPGPREGALASGLGLLVSAGFFFLLRRS